MNGSKILQIFPFVEFFAKFSKIFETVVWVIFNSLAICSCVLLFLRLHSLKQHLPLQPYHYPIRVLWQFLLWCYVFPFCPLWTKRENYYLVLMFLFVYCVPFCPLWTKRVVNCFQNVCFHNYNFFFFILLIVVNCFQNVCFHNLIIFLKSLSGREDKFLDVLLSLRVIPISGRVCGVFCSGTPHWLPLNSSFCLAISGRVLGLMYPSGTLIL